jgi:D-alanyl-D-alanine endopeptidase (penicillin-binding protein 7)
MLVKLLAHILVTAALLQTFPFDAGVVEQSAALPDTGARRGAGIETTLSLLYGSLPRAFEEDRAPHKIDPKSIGVVTSAVSALVVDARSGAVLYEKDIDESRSIGSVTKLMTSLVFLSGNPDLTARARIQSEDVRSGGREHIAALDEVSVRDLILASLVSSDNSATMALVRLSGFAEGDFVARMNEKAAEIGMASTTFRDPTGLSFENRSVAPDIIALLKAALGDGVIRSATEQATALVTGGSGRIYTLENTNELLEGFINEPPYKIVGGKTGYLPEAGYCLGVHMQKDGGQDIYVVVLGADSKEGRLQDVKALTVWAYKTFAWPNGQNVENT